MNISNIAESKELCCGCGACAAVCPVQAVALREDETGQPYPVIDGEKCTGCSLCTRVCCENNAVPQVLPMKAMAASYRNQAVSARSSSGGIFAALAEAVLADGGIVYGTSLDARFRAEVIGIESLSELPRLQGSQYVRSAMGKVYGEIKRELDASRKVLFSGVPCQVAALKQYLRRDYANLLTVDIVCHGTPSNRMFLDYLQYMQEKEKRQITAFYFREKAAGRNLSGKPRYQQDHLGRVVYQQKRFGKTVSGQKYVKAFQSSYYKLFLNCASLRESCYQCKFAGPARTGDITLCDYWGVDEVHPEFVKLVRAEGLSGISAVLINTEAGKALIERIGDRLLQRETDYAEVRKHNPQLNHPSLRTKEHETVMELYAARGYEAVDRYYFSRYRTKIILSTLGQALPDRTKKRMLAIKRKLIK